MSEQNMRPNSAPVNVDQSNNQPISELHACALRAAASGVHVFPITPDCKKPPLIAAWQEAGTTDTATINTWWSAHPNANIGWVPARSGHVFVDLDCKPERPSGFDTLQGIEARHGERLPETWTIATPSGGEHRIYTGTLRTSVAEIGPGIDIRGGEYIEGVLTSAGYGLLPPSVVDGKPYTWKSPVQPAPAALPSWFVALDTKAKTEPRQAPADVDKDAPHAIERGRQYLRGVLNNGGAPAEGTRNAQCVHLANALGDFGIGKTWAAHLLETEWAAHGTPPDEPIAEIVANAYRSRQNELGCDYRPPGKTAPEMFPDVVGGPADDTLFATGEDRRLRDPKPIEELVPGLIEKHRVAYASGPGGLNKSRVAMHWGACVHTGTPIYGRPVERAHFVHVSYENGTDEDARRHQTLLRRLEIAPEALDDYTACDWQGRGPLLEISEAAEIKPAALWAKLAAHLETIPGHKFIVFDSAYDVFSFTGHAKINEAAVQRAIGWLDQQMLALDASGLMLMHPSQAGMSRGDNSGWSVAWVNRPRLRLSFKPVDGRDDVVELSVAKRNNGPKGRPIMLHWHDGLLTPDHDATEQLAVYRAVIDVARGAANGGRMLKKGTAARQSGIDHLTLDEIERRCGIRAARPEVHALLARAEHEGYLTYQEYDDNKRGDARKAGYRAGPKDINDPFPEWQPKC